MRRDRASGEAADEGSIVGLDEVVELLRGFLGVLRRGGLSEVVAAIEAEKVGSFA